MAGFGGLAVLSAIGGALAEPSEKPEELAFVDNETTISSETESSVTPSETTPITDQIPTTATPTTATPTTVAPEETQADLSDEQISSMTFELLVRSEFPLIDLAYENNPAISETVEDTGQSICSIARESQTQDQLSFAMLAIWSQAADETKLMFNNDLEDFAVFGGMALGTFCPEELERL